MKRNKRSIKNNKGFTLVEVIVSIGILSVIAMTFLNVFLTSFNNSLKAQEITNYTYATQAVIEELRTYDYGKLLHYKMDHPDKEAFDINGDGRDDCYMKFSVVPYGSLNVTNNGKEPAFVHMIYLVDKVLVIDNDGNMIYTSAKVNPTIDLYVEPNTGECTLTVNGITTHFTRNAQDRHVGVILNLNYKDLGYNTILNVTGDIGHVISKAYGNEMILEEYIFKQNNQTKDQRFSGIENANSSLVKIKVELYHEQEDDAPFFDMFEIVEVPIGNRQSLEP
ncbi:MAG: type II secretion system protein [Eubacteriales bacterium]